MGNPSFIPLHKAGPLNLHRHLFLGNMFWVLGAGAGQSWGGVPDTSQMPWAVSLLHAARLRLSHVFRAMLVPKVLTVLLAKMASEA